MDFKLIYDLLRGFIVGGGNFFATIATLKDQHRFLPCSAARLFRFRLDDLRQSKVLSQSLSHCAEPGFLSVIGELGGALPKSLQFLPLFQYSQ
jgi:hypothetical protein